MKYRNRVQGEAPPELLSPLRFESTQGAEASEEQPKECGHVSTTLEAFESVSV